MDDYNHEIRENRERVLQYLRTEDAQKRIFNKIQRSHLEPLVTIGRAAQFFGFTETKLRDLETTGLLNPSRSKDKGQRQYSLNELHKLAVIRELLDAHFPLSKIPEDIDAIWSSIEQPTSTSTDKGYFDVEGQNDEASLPIDRRIEDERPLFFWRYYAPHALRVALMLIGEMLPAATIGLILPLHGVPGYCAVPAIENLPDLGDSLIGWLTVNGSSHTMFTPCPSFEYPTDYVLHPLVPMREEKDYRETPLDCTLIVLERAGRRSKLLSLDASYVKLIRRLLAPLYENASKMESCFGLGMRNERSSATDINFMTSYQDIILEGLANMVITMGGRSKNGRDRWRFCHIMLPETAIDSLPLQQRKLITRAQSKNSPFVVGESYFTPQKSKTSLSIRAFQSGRMIYRPNLALKDRTPRYVNVEGPIHSNIAVPIGAENGQPVAVLYVASDEPGAFSHEDQQLLRIMGRLIENLLSTFNNRLQVTNDLRSLMRTPEVVDVLFGEFHSENEFMRDVESFLTNLSTWAGRKQGHNLVEDNITEIVDEPQEPEEVISFIAIDIDNPEILASQYGDQIMRHLNRTLGLRIQEMIAPLTTKSSSYQLYYMYASRFYLFLRGISLNKACEKAEQFRASLKGNISLKQSEVADSVLILPDISVHLAVTSYSREKCEEFLQEYSSKSEISAMISQTLDTELKFGVEEGGNIVMAWDPTAGKFGDYRPLPIMEG